MRERKRERGGGERGGRERERERRFYLSCVVIYLVFVKIT